MLQGPVQKAIWGMTGINRPQEEVSFGMENYLDLTRADKLDQNGERIIQKESLQEFQTEAEVTVEKIYVEKYPNHTQISHQENPNQTRTPNMQVFSITTSASEK